MKPQEILLRLFAGNGKYGIVGLTSAYYQDKNKDMLFGIGKSTFLGIDFGTSSIKVVELSRKDKQPVLVNYGEVPLKSLQNIPLADRLPYDQALPLHLRALLERLKPHTKDAYVALPAFSGLITVIEMPELEEKELEQAIKFEAHKYIPTALEDVRLSWDLVGYQEKKDGTPAIMEVLLVAALKKDVERYHEFLKAASLNMKLLELETFSLVRAVIREKPGLYLQIDIGARATNIVLVRDGRVKVSRNLDTGGNDITRTITEALEITTERAETLKKSEKDLLNNLESPILFPSLKMVISEAQRIMEIYSTKHPETKVDGIILSGGTAHLSGLVSYLSKTFSIPVSVGDPWQGIERPKNLTAEKDSAFSVALGLALAGIEDLTPRKKIGKKAFTFRELLNKKI